MAATFLHSCGTLLFVAFAAIPSAFATAAVACIFLCYVPSQNTIHINISDIYIIWDVNRMGILRLDAVDSSEMRWFDMPEVSTAGSMLTFHRWTGDEIK